jgi:alkanesulfonate monooxygenase SsuD/methylene tetrahydromethanopterin reductase-like flavin-dependent oxidoreductase (luciferase family)
LRYRPGATDPAVAEALSDLFDETFDYIEVTRRLWDSWEDDAEIRDASTGRFVDREKLHYIDFEGKWFSVKGPSITPRPPQGQPPVAVLAHGTIPYRLAARAADIVFVTPHDEAQIAAIRGELDAESRQAGRGDEPLAVYADLVVLLDHDGRRAEERKSSLDDLDGAEYRSDAEVFVGTPDDLADLLLAWRDLGIAGFRLRPGALPHDLEQITRVLVPSLRRRGAFGQEYRASSLRADFGLARPDSRFAAAGAQR